MDSSRYFQLTNDILLEYTYTGNRTNESGDATDRIIDLKNKNKLYKLENRYNGATYFFCRDGANDVKSNINYRNLVVPINSNDSKFVKVLNDSTNQYYNSTYSTNMATTEVSFTNEDHCDVYYDKCTIHFTSTNYIGSYDALIFQAYINEISGKKISLASFIHKRTDNLSLNKKPMMINQKIYTTHITFKIPSVDFIINNPNGRNGLLRVMSPVNHKLQEYTPITFNVLGIRNTYTDNYFSYYNTERLNSIQVPYFDKFNKVNIVIEEATDGDYFNISAKVNNGTNQTMSFSDYITSMDANPEEYIIMHDISLYEYYVTTDNRTVERRTHTEYYLVNMSNSNTDEFLDDEITYRPVCVYANKDVKFLIEDTLKIINTEDNTTIVKKGSYICNNPQKYGKNMGKIFLGDTPIKINVYNKRVDEDVDYVKITNSSASSNTIENHQYNITALAECTNIGISIQQVSSVDVES